MALIKFKLANTTAFSDNFASILLGKNGFQTMFGGIPLLAIPLLWLIKLLPDLMVI